MRLPVAGNKKILCRLQFPAELSSEPTEQKKTGGVIGARNRHFLDFSHPCQRARMIEELSQGEAGSDQPGPIQVTQNRPHFGQGADFSDQLKLLRRSIPFGAIVNQSVHPAPELFVERFAKFALPPKIERQVRIKVREDDVRQGTNQFAVELKGDLLGANLSFAFARQMAVGVDPCLGPWLSSRRIGEDEERPTGVLASDL